jgi:chromate transporter
MRLLIPEWSTLDPAALIIAIAAFVAMLRYHVSMLKVLGASALVGLLYHLVVNG